MAGDALTEWRQYEQLDDLELSGEKALFALYCRWREAAGGKPPPAWAGVGGPLTMAERELVGLVHVVSVAQENPLGFRFEMFGSRANLDGGRDYTGLHLGEYSSRMFVERVAADYVQAKVAAWPLAHSYDFVVNGYNQIYTRLILPFGQKGRVDRLLVAISQPGASAKVTAPVARTPRSRSARRG